MRTGTVTSRSIVKDLHKSRKETTSLVPAGLSCSLGAKGEEREESSLHNDRELSTLNLTSSAEPWVGVRVPLGVTHIQLLM